MHIDINHLTNFFDKSGVLSEELKEKIEEYILLKEKSFSMNDFKVLDMKDWVFDAKKITMKNMFNLWGKKIPFKVFVRNKDDLYPFFIELILNNEKGSPCITVGVHNQYNVNCTTSFSKEVVLKTRSKKASFYDELLHYWNSGKIMQQLVTSFDKDDVIYAQVKEKIKGKSFVDVNGKKLPQYQASMIAFLYEKVKAQKVHTLGSEPSEWGIPDSVSNRFSSGFVDSLQDACQLKTDNSQKLYNQFFVSYPDVAEYMKSFDSNYF